MKNQDLAQKLRAVAAYSMREEPCISAHLYSNLSASKFGCVDSEHCTSQTPSSGSGIDTAKFGRIYSEHCKALISSQTPEFGSGIGALKFEYTYSEHCKALISFQTPNSGSGFLRSAQEANQ